MSSEQDNVEDSQASQDQEPQINVYGNSDDSGEDQENQDGNQEEKQQRKSDNNSEDYNNEDLQQMEEDVPQFRRKWEFSKNKPTNQKLKKLEQDQYITAPTLSKHEYAKLIGLRAKQIYQSSALYHIQIDPQQLKKNKISIMKIAQMEIKNKAAPFILQRVHPNGDYELWSLDKLQ